MDTSVQMTKLVEASEGGLHRMCVAGGSPSLTSTRPRARGRPQRHASRLTPHASRLGVTAWHAGVACRHDWAPSHAGCQSGSRRALRRARAAHLPRLAACCLISSNWRRTERTWLGLGFGLRLGLGLRSGLGIGLGLGLGLALGSGLGRTRSSRASRECRGVSPPPPAPPPAWAGASPPPCLLSPPCSPPC